MHIGKLTLRLFGTYTIIALVFLFAWPLYNVVKENIFLQWVLGAFFVGIFWTAVYADVSNISVRDVKSGKYRPYKGFLAGFIAVIPVLVLAVLAIYLKPADENTINLYEVIIRIWLSPYTQFFKSFEDLMPQLTLIPALLFPVVAGVSYLDGPRLHQKVKDTIKKTMEVHRNNK